MDITLTPEERQDLIHQTAADLAARIERALFSGQWGDIEFRDALRNEIARLVASALPQDASKR